MDVNVLTSKLENQPDKIIQILEALGFENIKFNPLKNNLRFAREEQRNPTSCMLDCGTLRFFVFSTNQKGNLFSLIMDVKRCSFPDSLKFAAQKAGISEEEVNIKTHWPFGGFFLKLMPDYEEEMEDLKTYPEETLEPYANKYNLRFIKDGISLDTQQKFGVGYDVESNRITIPERATDGSLVGIMGRANYECEHDKRWLDTRRTTIGFRKQGTSFCLNLKRQSSSAIRSAAILPSQRAAVMYQIRKPNTSNECCQRKSFWLTMKGLKKSTWLTNAKNLSWTIRS